MKKIILFGDSFTQYGFGCERALSHGPPGWGDRLNEYFSRRADIYNRGCCQYNTRAALSTNLIPDVGEKAPAASSSSSVILATVWFGANDSTDPAIDKNKHVAPDEYERNLRAIGTRVKKLTHRIVFLTPSPILARAEGSLKNSTSEKYAAICLKVSKEFNLPCIDLFSVFRSHDNWETLISSGDGIHLSGKGDELIFKLLINVIAGNWPDIAVQPCPITKNYSNSGSKCDSLEPNVPFWDKIDPKNYKEQLSESLVNSEYHESLAEFFPKRPSIVFLGDSITQLGFGSPSWCQAALPSEGDQQYSVNAGWGDMIAARYSRRLDVYNRGLSGYNSKWALAAFGGLFPSFERRKFPVELVTIFLGANDAADATLNPTQHVSIPDFEANIEELVKRCRSEWDAHRIVLIGCPPIHKEKYLNWRRARTGNENKSEEQLLDRTLELAKTYSQAMERVSSRQVVPFVDLIAAFGDGDFADLLSDGLHLSPKGNKRLADWLIRILDQNWPEIHCVPDTVRKLHGFTGSVCHAFTPEQPWFTELVPEASSKESSKNPETTDMHKRVKL